MKGVHPDLARVRFAPRISFGPVSSRILRSLTPRPLNPGSDVRVQEIVVDGPPDSPDVGLRIFSPTNLTEPAPALLWIHGGGHIIGTAEVDDRTNIEFVRELGITVAAVRYRLGAKAPAPASVEDVYAALIGIAARAAELNIDPNRIAIGGASAGAGIAAALALVCNDRGGPSPVFQLLVYPMLDDRTVTRTDLDTSDVRVWMPKSNRYGWATYLGQAPGGVGISPYAAPARREDLSGLPPAWIGVGSIDLFHDEDVEYARRLNASGVPCELKFVEGAFHGFDVLYPDAPVSREFWGEQVRALRSGLNL